MEGLDVECYIERCDTTMHIMRHDLDMYGEGLYTIVMWVSPNHEFEAGINFLEPVLEGMVDTFVQFCDAMTDGQLTHNEKMTLWQYVVHPGTITSRQMTLSR